MVVSFQVGITVRLLRGLRSIGGHIHAWLRRHSCAGERAPAGSSPLST
jgi:hypothetical protein